MTPRWTGRGVQHVRSALAGDRSCREAGEEVGGGIGNCPLSERFTRHHPPTLAGVPLPEGKATREGTAEGRLGPGAGLHQPDAVLSGQRSRRFSNPDAAVQRPARCAWGSARQSVIKGSCAELRPEGHPPHCPCFGFLPHHPSGRCGKLELETRNAGLRPGSQRGKADSSKKNPKSGPDSERAEALRRAYFVEICGSRC